MKSRGKEIEDLPGSDEVLKKSGQIYKLQNENQKLLEKRASWKIKDYLFVFCIQQDPCTLSLFSFFGDII